MRGDGQGACGGQNVMRRPLTGDIAAARHVNTSFWGVSVHAPWLVLTPSWELHLVGMVWAPACLSGWHCPLGLDTYGQRDREPMWCAHAEQKGFAFHTI